MPIYDKNAPDQGLEHNPILKAFIDEESFYREKLLSITNRGGVNRMDTCCKSLNIILCREDLASYYFNINDLSLLVDILIREAGTNV